ncbi:DnaJ sub C member 12 [Coemansia sp. RSA 2611]|uniref:DnaJ sub C member 12 n=2 Tax=Coemansia TaxID=4863 RepID=A0A9W8L6B4_9FUNG|nr:DnaJ sub C member 12 [Coemansia sp. RSA 2675]KAJ2019004.1 DnaJ sub C member 12 [Coemansia sp. S85]KAJ2375469.1 DnaJ sub C member 12 [Coemansia sp. RSA 2611]KAJ2411933.1 DnaJ sub C member 12 [Coemansia sp. RSA 2530]KAJ2690662.1 DnaJ sub C member 12 [Coemansia spiralis]KAJ2698526.1 DnaJ sub C member 12 [Coemansia sp. IMI 209128]KAJ2792417.1 DnaJ sub C member 12 [Coemansia linderi]
MSTDYYDTLGCNPHSTLSQIHAEYRQLALQHHPDKNPVQVDAWDQIREAYETLGNEQRRAQYDRWRASRLPVPFAEWLKSPHAHAVHWSFDYQKRAIEMPRSVVDTYEKFRNYEI